MKTIRITRAEYDQLRELQVRERWDWPAWFSTNQSGFMWPGSTFGRTPDDFRLDVSGMSKILDQVKDAYLGIRECGGRFFVNETGGSYKLTDRKSAMAEVRFAEFKFMD
jgi:hypothetical protein